MTSILIVLGGTLLLTSLIVCAWAEYVRLLRHRVLYLEAAIARVCAQKLDDLCWMDLYALAEAGHCPMPDLTLLARETMLANCGLFVDCLLRCPADREEALRQYQEEKEEKNVRHHAPHPAADGALGPDSVGR